jgi:hypothetical protein
MEQPAKKRKLQKTAPTFSTPIVTKKVIVFFKGISATPVHPAPSHLTRGNNHSGSSFKLRPAG